MVVPPNRPFSLGFPYKPSTLGYPYFRKPPTKELRTYMKHYYSSQFLDSSTMISQYYDLPMDPDPWHKHGTQMMITKTAKNTSSKKHIYSQHSFNHTPKKDGVETTGFLLQVVYKKQHASPYKIYNFTKNKQKVENHTVFTATASIISPSW